MAIISTIQTQVGANRGELMVGSTGRLYTAYQKTLAAVNYLVMGYSDDAGVTWSEVAINASTSTTTISAAIDSQDVIHVVYGHAYIFSYRSFSALTWGSAEIIHDGTTNTDDLFAISVAVDSADKPHVAMTQFPSASNVSEVYYSNRVSGSWAARTQLSNNFIFSSSQVHPTNISIVINSINEMWIFFACPIGIGSGWGWLRYSGGTWTSITVQEFVFGGSIAPASTILSNNNIHVIWSNSSTGHRDWTYDYSLDTWSAITVTGGGSNYASLASTTDDNLQFIYGNSGGGVPVYKTYNGSTWSSATNTDPVSANLGDIGKASTTVWPKIGGVSTQKATSGWQFVFTDGQFGNAMFRFNSQTGLTLQAPQNKNYTRASTAALGASDSNLGTVFTSSSYSNVLAADLVYEDQTANNQYSVTLFKNKGNLSTDVINVSWTGKAALAPSVSTVYLQIYNRNSSTWETLSSNGTTGANVPFSLTGTKSTSLSNYYDGSNWVSCRIYQLAQ